MNHRVSAHLPQSLLTWGKAERLGDEVLVADQGSDLDVEVTLDQALAAGQCIEVWIHFVSDMEQLQVDDASARAWFGCQSASVPVEAFAHRGKVHGPGTFFPYRRYGGVRLTEDAAAGTTMQFSFRNVRMQTYEESLFNLRLAILDGDSLVGYLGDAFYVVVGGSMDHLLLVAPTCVETGESFDCQVVVRDRWGNKTSDALEELELDLDLQSPAGTLAFDHIEFDAHRRKHVVRGVKLSEEGLFYLRSSIRGAEHVRGISNPVVVRREWPEKVYWGDLHQHAYFADGRGTPAANYEFAISHSCLDFCSVAPPQEFTYAPGMLCIEGSPTQKGWEELAQATERYNGDDLVTILGSEAGTLGRLAGHMNSYYLDSSNRPELERLAQKLGPDEPIPSYEAYLEELESSKGEFLLLPHAHARGGPGVFDLPKRPDYQTNVEVVSVHGVFDECYLQWLRHGHLVGVHGGGDNHMTSTGNGNPGWHYTNTNGLTGLWSPTRDRRGVWEAIKDRRTWAVTGNQRIFLDFNVSDHAMGAIVATNEPQRRVRLQVAGTAPILKAELFRNGEIVRAHRASVEARCYLRVVWTDSMCSRRVDDSLTTGPISVEGASLSIAAALNTYHPTDRFTEEAGTIAFRTNAYSGTTRGTVLQVTGGRPEELLFEIDDEHLGAKVLEGCYRLSLSDDHVSLSRPLETDERQRRPLFSREPHQPEFMLDVDWTDPEWPRVLDLSWDDTGAAGDWYFVRIEQIDGNIAWSSPVWLS